jgi:sugar lactone lactonase YvrE
MHNSVVILDDGGFMTTQFMVWAEGLASVVAGEANGSVVEWHPGGVPETVLGTELSAPNGIVISDDERYLFVAALGAREIVRFDLSKEPITKAAVSTGSTPDNVRWGEPGKLLTAGGNIDGNGWSVVEVDAIGMGSVKVGGMNGAAKMQGISSALQIGDKIWVGTYNGDRIGYFTKQ